MRQRVWYLGAENVDSLERLVGADKVDRRSAMDNGIQLAGEHLQEKSKALVEC